MKKKQNKLYELSIADAKQITKAIDILDGNYESSKDLRKKRDLQREYTPEEVRALISKYLRMSYNDLHKIMMEKSILDGLTVFETIIASSMYKSYKNGDFSKMDVLLNRAGLKVNDKIEIHNTYEDTFKTFSRENIVSVLRKEKRLEDKLNKFGEKEDAVG